MKYDQAYSELCDLYYRQWTDLPPRTADDWIMNTSDRSRAFAHEAMNLMERFLADDKALALLPSPPEPKDDWFEATSNGH